MSFDSYRVSRQKSCIQCARAKRRCYPQTPSCPRCASKGISCTYKNEPLVSRKRKPEPKQISPPALTPDWFSIPELESTPDTVVEEVPLPHDAWDDVEINQWIASNAGLLNQCITFPSDGVGEIAYMDQWSLGQLARVFKSCPIMFAKYRTTPFIHSKLYDAWIPDTISDVFTVSAAYSSRNKDTEQLILRIVDQKTRKLLTMDTGMMSIDEHLAAVQALTLLCIIHLFDGDLRLRAAGETYLEALDFWNTQLRSRLPSVSENPTWQAWLFTESLRRSIIFAYFLIGAYSSMKIGYCTKVPRMKAVPVTAKSSLWKAPNIHTWQKDVEPKALDTVNYGGFTIAYENGEIREELDIFQKLLLIPCVAVKYRDRVQVIDEQLNAVWDPAIDQIIEEF